MSTNDYIRQSAQKYHWNKYYSVVRPVSIGTHPKNGMMDFINYDAREEVNGRMVWAELYYNRELTQKEMEDFEIVKGYGGGYHMNSYELAKKICDCLSDGYDDEEGREETEIALYNELSQIGSNSFIRVALLRLCERVEDL